METLEPTDLSSSSKKDCIFSHLRGLGREKKWGFLVRGGNGKGGFL